MQQQWHSFHRCRRHKQKYRKSHNRFKMNNRDFQLSESKGNLLKEHFWEQYMGKFWYPSTEGQQRISTFQWTGRISLMHTWYLARRTHFLFTIQMTARICTLNKNKWVPHTSLSKQVVWRVQRVCIFQRLFARYKNRQSWKALLVSSWYSEGRWTDSLTQLKNKLHLAVSSHQHRWSFSRQFSKTTHSNIHA